MMTGTRPDMPDIKGKLEKIKPMLTSNHIKFLNQSEIKQISELIENMIQNYNLMELELIIDELLKKIPVNDVFSIKIMYYKVKKEILCRNLIEANKFINLGLNKIRNIHINDSDIDRINKLFMIEKYKREYLSGVYKQSLEYYSAFESNINLDSIIRIEVSLNIGSIYLLTGDIQSCINIYNECFNIVKGMEKTFLQVKITHLLGEYYSKLGDFDYSKNFYKLSLEYSEDQKNLYYIGKNLVKLFIMDYYQNSNKLDDFFLLKLKNYQKQTLKSDFFSKIISIFLIIELREKISRLKVLIKDFNDQIAEPEILIVIIESLIEFQIKHLKVEYAENKVNDLLLSIIALENTSKKYNMTFYYFKSLLLKSKISVLKQNFSENIQILQDAIVSAENLKLTAYAKFIHLEIEKISLLIPLHQPSKNNHLVAEMLQNQQIFQLIDLFHNLTYRLSIIKQNL